MASLLSEPLEPAIFDIKIIKRRGGEGRYKDYPGYRKPNHKYNSQDGGCKIQSFEFIPSNFKRKSKV